MFTGGDCNIKPMEIERKTYSQKRINLSIDERVSSLYLSWSALLNKSKEKGQLLHSIGLGISKVPKAPHLENCKLNVEVNQHLDKRVENERLPPWTIWKGMLRNYLFSAAEEQLSNYNHQPVSGGSYPPWVCYRVITANVAIYRISFVC